MKTGDKVRIECDGIRVDGTIRLASENEVSLFLEFEAILDGHVGAMPVMRYEDGVYRSIITKVPVIITPK